jgi:hypothetical protein
MKRYRVYFNRELEWPQCWSIDEGTQASEINVVAFRLDGCVAISHNLPKNQRGSTDRYNTPFAWLEVWAHLTLVGGVAVFSRDAR